MLASLTIKNVVLIDQLTINFSNGLSALTGETGAGKSILLDSLGLGLGARADAGLVRHGEDQASVAVTFDLDEKHPALKLIEEQDLETDTTLILRRNVSKDGRSKAFINDQPVSVSLMKQVGSLLVEIHGQFETHNLLNQKYHSFLLDEYAQHDKQLKDLSADWKSWKESEKALISRQKEMDQAREEEDFYRTSLQDIDALSPQVGEDETLTNLRNRLMRREQIIENLNEAKDGLNDIESKAMGVWRALEKLDQEGAEVIAAMERVNVEIQEVLGALNDLSHEVKNNDTSLSDIDDRLFALKAQAKKHHCLIDELPTKREEIATALDAIENQDNHLAALKQDVEKNKASYIKKAKSLSASRQEKAKKLSHLVMKELPALKLEKAQFVVSVERVEEADWNAKGMNFVQFLVATNPGAQAGALNKIASGGEMSRFILALKVVLAEVGAAQTLVFDEVDSGIGGATAAAVGERLLRLAEQNQILVVTHSPQVAAMAAHHWIVSKTGQKQIKTNIISLNDKKDRREEVARMLSGTEITREARAAADKLLEPHLKNKSAA